MHLILLFIALVILSYSDVKGQSRRVNPFGGSESIDYKVNNSYIKTFDLSKIGVFGREETMTMFE